MTYLDRFKLNGRVAIVTGGARGFGRVFSDILAEAGASVVLTSRDLSHATPVAETIAKKYGVKTLGLEADVSKKADAETMVAAAVDAFGRVDILINNAGINIRGPIETLNEDDWDNVIDVNLKGPWLCCRAVAPIMKQQKWGRVVNVSSMLGQISLPNRTPYASSKGGLTLMTKTLALEWATSGINVNALCPGPFMTEINTALLNDPVAAAAMVSKVPLGRWGEPSEVGPAVLFLASPWAAYVCGQTLVVDGGATL